MQQGLQGECWRMVLLPRPLTAKLRYTGYASLLGYSHGETVCQSCAVEGSRSSSAVRFSRYGPGRTSLYTQLTRLFMRRKSARNSLQVRVLCTETSHNLYPPPIKCSPIVAKR